MDDKKKLHPARKLLLLLIPIVGLALAYAGYDLAGASRVGSSSKLGEVYTVHLLGRKYYVWYLEDRNGNVLEHGSCADKPYIFEKGDTVSITYSERGIGTDMDYYTRTYDLNQNPATEMEMPAERPLLDPLTYTRHKRFPVKKLVEPNAAAADLTLHGHPLWYWAVNDNNGEYIWSDGSLTEPTIEDFPAGFTLYYTESGDNMFANYDIGQPMCRDFRPESGMSSDAFAVMEDGKVLVRQALEAFDMSSVRYDESIAHYDGFVNTEPLDDPEAYFVNCNAIYERAKAEVSIPYTLVLERVKLASGVNPPILAFEVVFAASDEEDSPAQTVYMDASGVTQLVLDGRPDPEV